MYACIYTYVGEAFISCVFVCGRHGNARSGEDIKNVLWVPGPLWAGPSWAGPLWARPSWAPLGPYGPGPLGPGPYGPPWALMGQALMGPALMAPLGPYTRALMGWALMGRALLMGTHGFLWAGPLWSRPL